MKNIFFVLALIAFAAAAHADQPEVKYTLGMTKPQTHLFEVQIEIKNISQEQSLDLLLPVWRPGRYVVLDFAGGVQEFSAESNGKPLEWKKTDKATWHIATNGASSITARYKVYADEFGDRTRGLNDRHGFVDGTAVFMYVEKYRRLPLTLEVLPYNDWHATTGLESRDGEKNKFTAPDYDYFVDCPLEIGNQKDFPFDVEGVPHVLSIFGEGNWNPDTLIHDITKIVKAEKDFWGSFPYKRYVFLLELMPNYGGGTEHINSCALNSSPFGFKNPDSYRGFLGLISHEYFHTWNVKQLRPKGIHPYDYMKENYSDELWIAEGMTSYFDQVIMTRAGYTSAGKYIDGLGSTIAGDRSRPGNKMQSVADASFDSWIKYWKWNRQAFNAESDYYERGSMVSGMLDLEIRQQSGNKYSLDDVMREMYKRFPLSGHGYTLDDLQSVITQLTGVNIKPFFRDFIYGTNPLEWEKELAYAGLEVTCSDTIPKAWLGLGTMEADGLLKVTQVVANSPAYLSGLSNGDEILAINGDKAFSSSFSSRIREMKPGDPITLTCFQNDRLRTITVTLGTAPKSNYSVAQVKTPTDLQKAIYESWLGAKWAKEEKK